ncbi:MAG TPA: flagellar protein FlaG [Castellaniella sp.]|nr:flagellar protein FlaG [Castellaniella sp.]
MIQGISQALAAIAASQGTAQRPDVLPLPTTRPAAESTSSSGAATTGGESQGDPLPGQVSSLEKALESVNSNLQAWSTGMRFEIDEDAQRLVVSIIDSETGDVLRTVPSDAVLRVARMIVQLQGSGVDARA